MFVRISRPGWIASAFLALGLVLAGFGIWSGAESALFAIDGGHTTGTVVAKRIDPHYRTGRIVSGTGDSDTNAYYVSFVFEPAGGSEIRSELFVSVEEYAAVTVGAQVPVDYVRSFPVAMNALADDRTSSSFGLLVSTIVTLGAGSLFGGFGGWWLVGRLRYRALLRRLVATGVPTSGTVTDNDAARMRVNSMPQRRIEYRYVDGAHHHHKGLSDWMPRSEASGWAKGDEGAVRYDPDRPGDSAWFGQLDS